MKTKEEKAKEYSDNILLSDFFKVNHEKDFLAGYDQALWDSKAPEMLEMLKKIIYNSDVPNYIYDEAKQLIKEIENP